MAYVRKKGNQLAVVHGVRAPETQQVEQKTVFTFYSKSEALAAVGDERWRFQQIVEEDHPGVRFDWKKLEAEIRSNLDHLPDIYTYKRERVDDGFRDSLLDFARELMLADPQMLLSSAKVIQANRHELEHVKDLIDWRLKNGEQKETEWNRDNPFYWRAMAYRRDVPGEEREKLATLFERGQYEKAEALAHLLTECWPNYAEGYNVLGLIALDRALDPEDYVPALDHFDEAIRVGRTLFPKRIKKDAWWNDDTTRPYIRALMHKVQALNRLGDYVGALLLCERLETECFQDTTADRVAIYLNSGQWTQVVKTASGLGDRTLAFPLAFAHYELDQRKDAIVAFLHGAIEYPRTAKEILAIEADEPRNRLEAEDYDTGVALARDLNGYLTNTTEEFDQFFDELLEAAPVKALMAEFEEVRQRWHEHNDRAAYERMTTMTSLAFASETAEALIEKMRR